MKTNISRRDFLKGTAAGAIGLVATGMLAGCAADADQESTAGAADPTNESTTMGETEAATSAGVEETTAAVGNDWSDAKRYECDVCVVGMGAAGMTACAKAAEDGAKVIGFDRAHSFAETNNVNTVACWGVETKFQQSLEGHITKKEAFQTICTTNNYQANSLFARHAVDVSGAAVDMLQDGGVTYMPAYVGTNESNTMLERTGHIYATGGAERGAQFQKLLDDKGVTCQWGTTVKELIQEDGKVVGVYAVDESGNKYEVRAAGGVVVSCGGFIHNEEMVAKYYSGARMYSYSSAFCDGSGIKLAQSAGAQLGKNFSISMNEGGGVNHKSSTFMTTLFGDNGLFRMELLGSVVVNKYGKRFVDEGELCERTMYLGEPITREGGAFYTIVSQKTVDQLKQMSLGAYVTDVLQTVIREPIFNMYFAPTALENLDADIDKAISEGWCWKGESFEELQEITGLTHLAETMKNYNEMCKAGEDTEMYVKPNFLHSYEEGPFYVVENDLSAWVTLGGIKTNGDCCAVNADNDVIPGLYIGGVDGDFWAIPYLLGGTANGLCIASGYICGESAAKRALDPESYDAKYVSHVAAKQQAALEASENQEWKDGTYTATVPGRVGDVKVTVEIKDGKIASVVVDEHQETDGIGTLAVEQMPQRIVDAQSVNVDAVSAATATSNAIKAAVKECLAQAAK